MSTGFGEDKYTSTGDKIGCWIVFLGAVAMILVVVLTITGHISS